MMIVYCILFNLSVTVQGGVKVITSLEGALTFANGFLCHQDLLTTTQTYALLAYSAFQTF